MDGRGGGAGRRFASGGGGAGDGDRSGGRGSGGAPGRAAPKGPAGGSCHQSPSRRTHIKYLSRWKCATTVVEVVSDSSVAGNAGVRLRAAAARAFGEAASAL